MGPTSRTTSLMVRRLTSKSSARVSWLQSLRWVQDGDQDSLGVGDLLGEDPTSGSRETFPAAASVPVASPAGGLHGFGAPGHLGQFVA